MNISRGLMLGTVLTLTLSAGTTAFAATTGAKTGVATAQSAPLKPGLSELKPSSANSQLVASKTAFNSKYQPKPQKAAASGYTYSGAAVKANSK